MKITTRELSKIAVVAAIYFVLTTAFAPISYGNIQFRVAEILVLLCFIDKKYIIAVTVGTFLANTMSPLGVIDIIFGTGATLISAILVNKSKNIYIASIWPVIVNGVIIGVELMMLFKLPLFLTMLQVAAGEFVVVSIVGVIIFKNSILKSDHLKEMIKSN
jgi:uncharacterized membrane protein